MTITQRNLLLGGIAILIIGATTTFATYAMLTRKQEIPQESLQALASATTAKTAIVDAGFPPVMDAKWAFATKSEKVIDSAVDIKRLATLLRDGVASANAMLAKACFNPRHMVEVRGDGQTYQFFICFECSRLRIIWGNQTISINDFYFSGDFRQVADLFPQEESHPE